MRVTVRDAKVVGATKSFGEMTVVPGQNVDAITTPRGGVLYSGCDHPNAMRVQLDDLLLPPGAMPQANVGDSIAGDTVGVMDYSFSNPKLEVTATPTLTSGGLQREITRPQSNNQMAVSTFNVENLAPGDPQTKFDRLAAQVVHNLQSPDILALEEIQDNNGATSDGTVDSTQTTDKLIAAIEAAGDASLLSPSSPSATRPSSRSPTTSRPRAVTTRCSAAGSSPSAPRRPTVTRRARRSGPSWTSSSRLTPAPMSWCSVTSTTSSSATPSTSWSAPAPTHWSTCPEPCR